MSEPISYDEFAKVQLRVGKILAVEPHPNATKLLVLKVDLGEETPRTIVAGLRAHYLPENLVGTEAVFVANLAPVVLRGIESQGMILAAASKDDSTLVVLRPDKEMGAGDTIR